MPPAAAQGAERDRVDDYLASRRVIDRKPLAVLVDAFKFVGDCRYKVEASWGSTTPANIVYFLSHFHSDHYVGLSERVARTCGVVYASRPSAALLVTQLSIPPECAFPLDFGPRYCFSLVTGKLIAQSGVISGGDDEAQSEEDRPALLPAGVSEKDVFYVRLIPANHCPGAAMLLFTSVAFGTILHTGDFRFNGSASSWRGAVQHAGKYLGAPLSWCKAEKKVDPPLLPPAPFYEVFLEDHPALRRAAGHVEKLFLDNTFCDPKFKFISQWQATQGVVERLRSHFIDCAQEKRAMAQHHTATKTGVTVSCALLVGTYSIGKERVAFAIQEAFPRVSRAAAEASAPVPIHVTSHKYRLMHDMNFYPQRFELLGKREPVPTLPTGPSLAGDEQNSLNDAETMEAQQPSDELGNTNEGVLSEVVATACEVRLPESVGTQLGQTSAGGIAAEPTAPSGGNAQELNDIADRFLLTIFLVPLSSISYPPMAVASGRPLRRDRQGNHQRESDGDVSGRDVPLLSIGEGLGIDLSRYDRVLGVEPTGWAQKPKDQRVTDAVWLFKVPYSEHCAFHEMLSFVGFVNPTKVIPTVSFEQFKQHEPLFVERAPRLAPRWANTQPITRFLTKKDTPAVAAATGPPPRPPRKRFTALPTNEASQSSDDVLVVVAATHTVVEISDDEEESECVADVVCD